LFKAPHHKFHLEALASAYPDIRFIMTHRDPGKVVPSYASIVLSVMPPADGERDLHGLGREISDHLRIGMEHAIAERARIGEDRFLDVHHRQMVADPQGTIRRVYEWLVRADHRPDPFRLRLLRAPFRRGAGGLTHDRTSDMG
jgi:hypothetical protein